MAVPIFNGTANTRGTVDLELPASCKRWVKTLAPNAVEVIIRPRRSKRSLAQNRWLHGPALDRLKPVFDRIAAAVGDDIGYEKSEMKLVLLGEHFGYHYNAVAQKDMPIKSHTSQLTTAEFSKFMEWLVDWAGSQHQVYIPLPDDAPLEDE
jgi:hypothetical protein